MDKQKLRDLCNKVRSLCEKEGVEFLFITEGCSVWNTRNNGHLKKVKDFHKELEEIEIQAEREQLRIVEKMKTGW